MLTVFGSINVDVSVRAGRLPEPGETLLGRTAVLSPGGKGANQAHAAQRFGVPTRLFGTVGDDAFTATALACRRPGAQAAQPARAEIDARLREWLAP